MPSSTWRLTPSNSALVVVDVQERLMAAMPDRQRTLAGVEKLIRSAEMLAVPTLVTLQYVKGLGPICPELAEATRSIKPFEKMSFSCCGDEAFGQALQAMDRQRIILCGVETHVCVQQTALDLIEHRHQVYLPVDATCSRHELDSKLAVDRLVTAGAIATTVEAVIFELLREAGTPLFKQMLPLFK